VVVSTAEGPFELIALPSRRSQEVVEITAAAPTWLGVSLGGWDARQEIRDLALAHGGRACFASGNGSQLES
jgi:hypothetical protein